MNSEKHKRRSLMPNIKWYALVCCPVPAPFTEAPLSLPNGWVFYSAFFLIYSKPFVKPSSVTISSNFYFGFSNSLLKLSLMRQLSLQQHPRNLWLLFSISSTNASNKAWPHIKFRIPFTFSCIPFLHNSWVIFLPNMHNANACTILPCK